MGNFIPVWKIVAIADLSRLGFSHRAIATKLEINRGTTRKYVKLFGPEKCPCGQPATHKAWCSVRVALSPNRQKFLDGWTIIRPETKRFWAKYAADVEAS